MAKQVTLSVVTRTQDNGDGGYTTYAYNTEDEMIADHPRTKCGEMTPEKRREILIEDDGYENGYIGQGTVTLNIDDNGAVSLAKPLRFHAGQ